MARVPKPSGLIKNFGKVRDLSDSRKPIGSRSYHKYVHIIVEGTKTEYHYFCCLKRKYNKPSVKISVETGKGKTDVGSLCKKAVNIKNDKSSSNFWDSDLDQIWVVADYESAENKERIEYSIELCNKYGIYLIISNPCFEYWYLLHFADTNRPFFDANSVCSELSHYIKEYDKGINYFTLLYPLTDIAISRINKYKGIDQQHWSNFCNPSTNVDKVINDVFAISKS